MTPGFLSRRLSIALLVLAYTSLFSMGACAASTTTQLIAKLAALDPQLRASPFGRPLTLESTETADGLKGDIFAMVDQPIKKVVQSLRQPGQWCEAMLLHINNRACTVSRRDGIDVITLSVVRRYDQRVDSAFVLPFSYRLIDAAPQHLQVQLDSATGPMGTSNYRIGIEAIAIDDRRSFLHFSYAYDEGVFARTATKAYLATFGRAKVGFTAVGQAGDGKVDLIRGTRGLVERNAIRYFLAVDAYLSADSDVPRQQAWFNATEQYPLQLHEIDSARYLELKAEDHRAKP